MNSIKDIVFVGSGISNAFTLLHFLKKIREVGVLNIIDIAVIDKFPEFNKGIPYGKRSSNSVLLITNLKNFLPEPYRDPFKNWLTNNKERLLNEFIKNAGPLSLEWLTKNEEEIKNNEWEELFIPRTFFGEYIDEQVKLAIKENEKSGKVKVTFENSKIVDLTRAESHWELVDSDNKKWRSKKVILGIGSLPNRYLWKNKKVIRKEQELLFINDLYNKTLNGSLEEIKQFLNSFPAKGAVNIAIIGANASALEILYKINDHDEMGPKIGQFYFLSTYGLLPDAIIDDEKLKQYQTSNLNALESKSKLLAIDIMKAANQDLDRADRIELGAYSTVGIISSSTMKLLKRLDLKEKRKYACLYGNEIGRRQRCAGEHYLNTVQMLKAQKRFEHISGRFEDMVNLENTKALTVQYLDTATKESKQINKPVQIVINCSGSMDLTSTKVPRLLKNMVKREYAQPNESKIGFNVNDYLEVSPDLHLIGPLLAGNIIENNPIWHVEHCGRIIRLSEYLSTVLSGPYLHRNDLAQLQLILLDIGKNTEDQNTYEALLKKNWNGNPYGSISYFKHHQNDKHKLIAFQLVHGDETIAIMPLVIREIDESPDNHQFYDVISPYGYSGPLFKDGLSPLLIHAFWDKVDQWYRENNVVSEFIRFSLNHNHKFYNGELQASLKNVKGKINRDWQLNWDCFASKVRNNYRRAISDNITFTIYRGKEITCSVIEGFHEIYIETMDRKNASGIYFFSIDYFKQLIASNPEKFLIAFSHKDGKIVSTELLILNGKNLHAFLGGTRKEFFSSRPNDYMRVEIIKWAAENDIDYYTLGGGRKDDDGLYRSKKALFPKDVDSMYYTGRKVLLPEVYNKLTELRMKHVQVSYETIDAQYFPKYRVQKG